MFEQAALAINLRTKAEPQQIVAQGYSHAYSTLFYSYVIYKEFKLTCIFLSLNYCVDGTINTSTLVNIIIIVSSMDSDLEAFSHNPTNVSIVALTAQPTTLPNI